MAYCHPLNAYTTYKPFLYKMNMLLWKWNWSIYKPLATMTLTSTITDYARRISHTRTMLLQILWRSWKCEFKVILLWFLYKHQLKQVSPPPFVIKITCSTTLLKSQTIYTLIKEQKSMSSMFLRVVAFPQLNLAKTILFYVV